MFTPPPPPPPCVEECRPDEDSYQYSQKAIPAEVRASYAPTPQARAMNKHYADYLARHGRTRCTWGPHRRLYGGKLAIAVPVVTTTRVADTEQRFHRLANEWTQATMHISSASDLINDARYQEIINLGWDAVPFLLTALGLGQFLRFYQNFRRHLHVVELVSGALLLFIGGLVFFNKLTWLSGKLTFLNRFSM